MLIFRAKIALNAVICMISYIFSLIMESWLLRSVSFDRSSLQFYILKYIHVNKLETLLASC